MLARLSIRDIVLIERLDIDFGSGLAALTGETGAGKSILLDAFALALGARGEAALVREGAEQGQVIATFEIAKDHPARRVLAENDLGTEDDVIVRRVQFADGRTRAFVNDQPVSVQILARARRGAGGNPRPARRPGLCRSLDPPRALDAFGGIEADAAECAGCGTNGANVRPRSRRIVPKSSAPAAKRNGCGMRSMNSAISLLQAGEETSLADRRAAMMQAEKAAEDLRATQEAVAGPQSAVPPLATAVRRLERRAAQAPALIEPVVKAIDAALNALDEARRHLDHALRVAHYDPLELERIEERLFALRAAARKYNAPVDELAALERRYAGDLALIDAGAERLAALEARGASDDRALPRGGAGAFGRSAPRRAKDRQGGQRRA